MGINPQKNISPTIDKTMVNSIKNDIPMVPSNPTLTMGAVELSVQDLKKMTEFYVTVVGFELVSTGAGISNLGDDSRVFLKLIEEKNYTFPIK